MTDHNKAIDDLNSRYQGFLKTRNAPTKIESEGIAFEVQEAAGATEKKQELLLKKEMKKSMILINNNALSLVLTRLSIYTYPKISFL